MNAARSGFANSLLALTFCYSVKLTEWRKDSQRVLEYEDKIEESYFCDLTDEPGRDRRFIHEYMYSDMTTDGLSQGPPYGQSR